VVGLVNHPAELTDADVVVKDLTAVSVRRRVAGMVLRLCVGQPLKEQDPGGYEVCK
jgi:hypothetical protein